MRATLEKWLLGHWYCDLRPPAYLRLLEPVYRYAFNRSQINKGSLFHPSTPLIVVGNITAGGTGKTPVVIALCEMAAKMGLKVGIASTGYGRKGRETMLVQANADSLECGDEPLMMAKRTGCPVAVAVDRVDAVRLLDEMDLDLLISDDGLQQANLASDIAICVVDGKRGLGNGHLIPAGPLRESSERLQKVDYIISNGQWSGRPPGLEIYCMQLMARDVRSLEGMQAVSVEDFRKKTTGNTIHAVAGIGNPARFFSLLNSLGLDAHNHGFEDHHDYRLGDFKSMEPASVIIMTEKDAVKCRSLGLQNAYYLNVDAHLPEILEHKLVKRITSLKRERERV